MVLKKCERRNVYTLLCVMNSKRYGRPHSTRIPKIFKHKVEDFPKMIGIFNIFKVLYLPQKLLNYFENIF